MEEAYRTGGILALPDTPKPKKVAADPAVKKEDVDLVVRLLDFASQTVLLTRHLQVSEFEIPRAQAEKLLSENGGDLKKTLTKLIYP